MTAAAFIDHLVVAAETLEQGVRWCEETLGVTPGPGGRHPLMSTHNRLLRISTPTYPLSYLEIIAIDPGAPDPGRHRWFDLDDPTLRQHIRKAPRLIHFVARTQDASSALDALRNLGIDRGALLEAQRPTPAGVLRWRISVRADGQRLFYGALPTLIEWGEVHPARDMPASGLTLQSLRITHPREGDLGGALSAIGLRGVELAQGAPELSAVLMTPRGVVQLLSQGV